MAVVGKVGTYAQVQPIQGPDFGKMVKDQFDKMDAEDKAAKAAKAKADKEKQDKLDKLSLGDQETLNIDAFNVKRFEVLAQKRDRFAQLKKEGKLNDAQALINDLSTEGNAVKQANATMKEIFENESKYDPTYVSKAKDLITNLNSANVDVVDKGNGDIRYTIYADPEKKEVLEKEITVAQYLNKIRLPYVYEPTKEAKLFASTFKLDEIEKEINTSGKIGTVEAVDLMNNPRVLSRISKRAEDLTKDDRAMAHFGTTIDKFETRANAYTKEEKESAKAYFEKNFKDAYAEKVDMSISQKRGGSGSKDVIEPGKPAVYLPESIKPEGAASEPLSGAKTVTISNSKGTTLTVGGMPMDRVLYNPGNGQLYIGILYSGSGKQSLTGEGASAGISESNKTTKWFTQNSDEFDKFKATYNAAFGKNLQTIEDFKNELFL
jgi:hypothetical protein